MYRGITSLLFILPLLAIMKECGDQSILISLHTGNDPMVYEWSCIFNSPYHQHNVLGKNLLKMSNPFSIYSNDDIKYDIEDSELQCSDFCTISHRWTASHNQGSQYGDANANLTEYNNNRPQKLYINSIHCSAQASLKEAQFNFGMMDIYSILAQILPV